jgi:hypothetical protein
MDPEYIQRHFEAATQQMVVETNLRMAHPGDAVFLASARPPDSKEPYAHFSFDSRPADPSVGECIIHLKTP